METKQPVQMEKLFEIVATWNSLRGSLKGRGVMKAMMADRKKERDL